MIRPATPDDLPRLQGVRSWLSEPTPNLLETTISNPGSVFVSTDGDEPVGYILTLVGTDAYIAELVVEPAHRREGRARRLLQTALDSVEDRGCTRVSITVHEENEAARSLYESMGFNLAGRESGYYADGGDGLQFKTLLSQ